jgi:hypothetical protein
MENQKEEQDLLRVEIASKGGKARAEKLSTTDRQAIARQAALARWGTDLPQAEYAGRLLIAEKEIVCAVLDNTKRVLTQETFLKAIGRAGKAKAGTGSERLVDGLPPFLAADNLQPFISDELRLASTPVPFRNTKGTRGFGFDALLLPMVCEVYLEARDAGALLPSQRHIAAACDLLIRGLARVGIIALVDEATGYQERRAKDELQKILDAYVTAELRPWTKTFPEEFFKEIYRLQGWEFKPGNAKRTPFVGYLINKYIYEQMPPGVLEELKRLNPVTEKGYRKHKHHSHLTVDVGNPALNRQIIKVMTLMSISDTKTDFEEVFAKAFKLPVQTRLSFGVDTPKD